MAKAKDHGDMNKGSSGEPYRPGEYSEVHNDEAEVMGASSPMLSSNDPATDLDGGDEHDHGSPTGSVHSSGASSPHVPSSQDHSDPKSEKISYSRRKRATGHMASVICQFVDTSGRGIVCKQRAILGYKFCIRHILLDPSAPYKQCEHHRKPKSKKDLATRCTNAIRKDKEENFCSTHLIMNGMKEAKKKEKASVAPSTNSDGGVDVTEPAESTQVVSGNVDCSATGEQFVPSNEVSTILSSDPHDVSQPFVAYTEAGRFTTSSVSSSPLIACVATSTVTSLIPRQQMVAPTSVVPAMTSTRQSLLPQAPSSATTLRQYVQNNTFLSGNSLRQQVPSSSTSVQRQPALFPVAIAGSRDTRQPVLAQLNMESKRHFGVPTGLVSSLEPHVAASDVTNNMPQGMIPHQMAEREENRIFAQQPPLSAVQGIEQHSATAPMCPPTIIESQPNSAHIQRAALSGNLQHQPQQQQQQQQQQKANFSQRQIPPGALAALRAQAHRTRSLSSTAIQRNHPQLAAKLLEGGVRNARNSRYAAALSIAIARQNQPLPWNAPPIARRTPPSSEDEDFGKEANGSKVIRLRMKRQRRRMVGIYRAIPEIDSMCRAVEDVDYDKTDLFPLGLEPSDDEDATYPSSSILPTASLAVSSYSGDLSTQLYLIKKQLRLERHALLKQAQLNAHIMCASRRLPLSVGAALRQRCDPSPPPLQLAPASLRRCCQLDNTNKQRCERACLPMSNHCVHHVLYNVNQRLFVFCTQSFCRRPVNSIDALLWDGKCPLHRQSREDRYGPAPVYENSSFVSSVLPVCSPPGGESSAASLLFQNDPPHVLLADTAAPLDCQLSLDVSHSWDDVTEFLMSEGFPVDSPNSQVTPT
ncbi:unnamed protein product [Angiostrongylus costaricensis]|uniref:KAT8 regulatory NSL complex subunit 2 n=1 Tax=Angiostrongylus costaricensis TaxID=334426 RepID=A0A0R3PWQ4_ANGCS|nr:unnamed protein product [Angiostrongylus costaricensis]